MRSWVSSGCRVLLAGVFTWSGLAKMADPDAAVRAVRAYRILPESLVRLFAWGLPFVELGLAALLLLGISVRLSAWLSGGLLVMFMAAIASAWARGLQIDCGCFGGGGAARVDAATFVGELLRDAGLLLVAGWLMWYPESRLALGAAYGEDLAGDEDDAVLVPQSATVPPYRSADPTEVAP